jgi:predicted membrane protein
MSINIDENKKDPYERDRSSNKVLAGGFLLIVGILFLFRQLNFFFFPWWLFRWPMWIIAFGIFSGVKHNFRNSGWIVMIMVGVFFLLNDIFPFAGILHNFWPLVLIVFGISMIMNRNRPWNKDRWDKHRWKRQWEGRYSASDINNPNEPVVDYTIPNSETNTDAPGSNTHLGDDYLDAVSIFSGAKKRILSKDFKGGEIVNIFGGADIDLTQADIHGRVYIDVTQVFGGIKLIVPPHWHVTSDMVSLFAGFDDKRMMKSDYGSDKILVLKGTSIFAGVDIRSY